MELIRKWSAGSVDLVSLPMVASELAAALPERGAVALQGPMGAGKTTIVAALCKVWGMSEPVSSPTFSLVQSYLPSRAVPGAPRKIYHLDLYRLESDSEVIDLDLESLMDEDALLLIEWPERAADIFPADGWLLRIGIEQGDGRSFELLRASGEKDQA